MPAVSKKTKQKPQSNRVVRRAKRTDLVPLPALSLSEKVEQVLIAGDLSPLTTEQRVEYYRKVSQSLGLNPLTQPFSYILFKEFDGAPARLSLYANKSCAEQLRKMHGISVLDSKRIIENDCAIYEVTVSDRTGRTDSAAGIVPLFKFKDGKRIDLAGREWANAVMKAHTKAKRRATLSICGLAFLDESELDTMQVVGGVTPGGRIYTYENEPLPESRQLDETARHGHEPNSTKAKQAENALAAVEEEDRRLAEERAKKSEKSSPDPVSATQRPLGTVELDFSAEPAYLRGDLSNLIELIKKHTKAYWDEKEQWWRISASEADTIRAMCQQCSYSLREIRPSGRAKEAPATGGSAEPNLVKGVLERVIAGMTGKNTPLRQVTMLLPDKKKPTWTAFDKELFPFLDKGIGKEAEVFIQTRGKYTNLVGLKRIGAQEFEDGKIPCVQRDREPGTPNLFGGGK